MNKEYTQAEGEGKDGGDILQLAKRFISKADEQFKTGQKRLSKEAENYLLTNKWQSEEDIETVIKKACILSDSEYLGVEDFDLRQRQMKSIGEFIEERLRKFIHNINRLEKFNLYDTVIPEVERSLISMVLKETKGNQIKAANLLGINRNTLRDKIKKLKIDVKRKPD
ncbi:MAG: hypothetical protein HY756_02010 [Nitrospirae bacterium]|nr:hypothetical protein [Nitrospirota bacterium]